MGVVVADVIPDKVGVLGATSMVGACLLPLLTQEGFQVTAYSRRLVDDQVDGVAWQRLSTPSLPLIRASLSEEEGRIPLWICVTPIWVLPDYFSLLEAHGVRRVVVLSSTSLFTKNESSDSEEQAMACRFADAEARVQSWAEKSGVEWVVLRPTLIYGLGRDKNIVEIARFIKRFGFFPLFGKAAGLRQPIHTQDVAAACITALSVPAAPNRAYNISGGETLAYRDMVTRVFAALGRPTRLLPVPLSAFLVAITLLRCLPRYRNWSIGMAERMNQDLVFDHGDAVRDLAFKARSFELSAEDVAAI